MPHTGQSGRVLSSSSLRASGPSCARVKVRIWLKLDGPQRMASRMQQRDEESRMRTIPDRRDTRTFPPPGAGLSACSNTLTSSHSSGLSAGAVQTRQSQRARHLIRIPYTVCDATQTKGIEEKNHIRKGARRPMPDRRLRVRGAGGIRGGATLASEPDVLYTAVLLPTLYCKCRDARPRGLTSSSSLGDPAP